MNNIPDININDLTADIQESGAIDLGFFLKIHCFYGDPHKLWKDIKQSLKLKQLIDQEIKIWKEIEKIGGSPDFRKENLSDGLENLLRRSKKDE